MSNKRFRHEKTARSPTNTEQGIKKQSQNRIKEHSFKQEGKPLDEVKDKNRLRAVKAKQNEELSHISNNERAEDLPKYELSSSHNNRYTLYEDKSVMQREETATTDEIYKRKNGKLRNYSLTAISRSKVKDKPLVDIKDIGSDNGIKDKVIQKKRLKQNALQKQLKEKNGKAELFGTSVMATSVKSIEAARDYLKSGSDENASIEASEKFLNANSKLLQKVKDYSVKRRNGQKLRVKKLDTQIRKRQSKLEFKSALQGLKKDTDYQKSSSLKKFQKKRHMKSAIYKKQKSRLRDRIKESLLSGIKGIAEYIKRKSLRLGGILLGLFLLIAVGMNACSLIGGVGAIGSTVLSTSYLASDYEITTAETLMTEYEADLVVKIQNVPKDYKGYDVYRYEVGRVGHDPHELIAYLTAKYGEFKYSNVESEIRSLFNECYHLSFREEREVYTETETVETTDPDTGEKVTTTVEVEKVRRILITTLKSKGLDTVCKSKLKTEEAEYYQTLMATKGNFMNLHSPIKGEWKNKISSMYGYRADPFTGEKRFHSGLDIASTEGTPLLAVFDGTISHIGSDSDGFGNHVWLTDKNGNSALYAHCSSITTRVGQVVKKGDEIAQMGSTGRSTGSHLHLELHLADRTRVNPYFYLYSEEKFNHYTSPNVSSYESFNWKGGNAQETVWGYLVTHGYTKEAAAGIMGNIEAESGFRTDAVENSVTNPGEGIGLIQWSFGRKSALISFATSQGKHWSDIGVQIAYLEYEMNGSEGRVFPGGVNGFKNLNSVDDATYQFCWLFERPNAQYAHYDRRISAAHGYYQMYKDFDVSKVKP